MKLLKVITIIQPPQSEHEDWCGEDRNSESEELELSVEEGETIQETLKRELREYSSASSSHPSSSFEWALKETSTDFRTGELTEESLHFVSGTEEEAEAWVEALKQLAKN